MKRAVCMCVCVCPKTACPFDLAALQTHTERRFCVPRQEVCFHLGRLGQLHPSKPPSRDKGEQSGMSDWDQAGNLFISGGGVKSVFGSRDRGKFLNSGAESLQILNKEHLSISFAMLQCRFRNLNQLHFAVNVSLLKVPAIKSQEC